MAHKKPNILDTPRERKFQKLATNGVVKLFNAVNKEQKNMGEKLTVFPGRRKFFFHIKIFWDSIYFFGGNIQIWMSTIEWYFKKIFLVNILWTYTSFYNTQFGHFC